MKEYNAKMIVNNDELKIMYECDREKNKDCKGYANCGPCNHTTDTRKIKARKANKFIEDNKIEIEINLEAEKAIEKLEQIKQLLIEINEKANEMGIDLGQEKEYTVMRTYYNGELASEEKIQYK